MTIYDLLDTINKSIRNQTPLVLDFLDEDDLKRLSEELHKLILIPKGEQANYALRAQTLLQDPNATTADLRSALQDQLTSARHYAHVARLAETLHHSPVFALFEKEGPHPILLCCTDPDAEARIATLIGAHLWAHGIRTSNEAQREAGIDLIKRQTGREIGSWYTSAINEIWGKEGTVKVMELLREKIRG
jgi:hypothetical protein